MLIGSASTWIKIPSPGEKKGLFLPVPSHGGRSKGRLSIPLCPLLSHYVCLSSAAAALARKAIPPRPVGTLWLAVCRAGRAAGRRRDRDCLRAAVLPAAPTAGETASNELGGGGGIYSLEIPGVLCAILHCILTHIQTAAFLPFLFHFTRNNACCFDSLHLTSKPGFFCCLPLDAALHLTSAQTPAVFTQFIGRHLFTLYNPTWQLGHGLGASIPAPPLCSEGSVTP